IILKMPKATLVMLALLVPPPSDPGSVARFRLSVTNGAPWPELGPIGLTSSLELGTLGFAIDLVCHQYLLETALGGVKSVRKKYGKNGRTEIVRKFLPGHLWIRLYHKPLY